MLLFEQLLLLLYSIDNYNTVWKQDVIKKNNNNDDVDDDDGSRDMENDKIFFLFSFSFIKSNQIKSNELMVWFWWSK